MHAKTTATLLSSRALCPHRHLVMTKPSTSPIMSSGEESDMASAGLFSPNTPSAGLLDLTKGDAEIPSGQPDRPKVQPDLSEAADALFAELGLDSILASADADATEKQLDLVACSLIMDKPATVNSQPSERETMFQQVE